MSELEIAFAAFDDANPEVWELFRRFAAEAIEAGHVRLSASLIIERIRWETTVVTTTADVLKLNNNFTAYYARKWNRMFATPDGPAFELRITKSERFRAEGKAA